MTSDISTLLFLIRSTEDCIIHPVSSLPNVPIPLALPNDVVEFYSLCGGVEINGQGYSVNIVPPDQVLRANPVIISLIADGEISDEGEISATWYIIADDGNGDYLTIDLDPSRLGRCYDSFHETRATIGGSPIIARSFTELLYRLYANRGQYWYWLEENFESLGDAYD